MNDMNKHRHLSLIVGFLMMVAPAGAAQINTAKSGESVERHLSGEQTVQEWSLSPNETDDIKRIKVCRVETVCKLRFREGQTARTRVRNLVVPLLYQDENMSIPESFTRQVRQGLDNLRDKRGVTVRFLGYTDTAPLTQRDADIYGNHLSLSKAMAQRVALGIQESLGLPTSTVESDGRGEAHPVASNETARGRASNRRIEVEFWYDDPLQELPDEPQLCPGDIEETVTKVYDPPWGSFSTLKLENGKPIIPPGYAADLNRALKEIADRNNARLRFIGYTKNERMDRRAASVYGDDIGLSAARARKAMDIIVQDPLLADARYEHEGRGYVQSDDVVNMGFIQGQESFVRVQVVYDEPLPLDNYEGVDITRLTQELRPKSPYALNVMHITVDGKPIDDPGRSSSDIQRCTDVALDNANIQFRFENLEVRPRLAVAADPVAVSVKDSGAGFASSVVHFRMYSNYTSFLERAEIRIFEPQQSLRDEPFDIIAVDKDGFAEWHPAAEVLSSPTRELKYVLRAYDSKHNFDETEARLLWLNGKPLDGDAATSSAVRFQPDTNYERTEIRIFEKLQSLQDTPIAAIPIDNGGIAEWQPSAEVLAGSARELKYLLRFYDSTGAFKETEAKTIWLNGEGGVATANMLAPKKLLGAYGENDLANRGITLGSGTVKVQGSNIPVGYTVWVAGRQVPVDPKGAFTAEEILPNGTHTVEVAVLDEAGNGSLYLRDLEFKRRDLFYVGVADITLSKNGANGPVNLLQGENAPQPYDSSFDGRLAFYMNGKVSENWRLTASADTREGPMKDLFSNFLDKSPDSLFRRINPNYHYMTFGDSGVVEEMAPTLGKFYLKASHGENYGMWGNFKVSYLGNELAHVDRGLYGATAHFGSAGSTGFGERRISIDGFAAEPGTMPSYEEFRGTGGSIYYLRHQDILRGSERVRIELRDKDSNIVTGVVNLRYGVDYDIDYLQGRLLLSQPLSSTADDNLLVRSSGLSGNEAGLVVRYEYTPGFDKLDAVALGGQGHFWFNDHVRLGLTANANDEGDANSSLGAADLTFRKSANSWIKVQTARSDGLLSRSLRSNDGGFGFQGSDEVLFADANAWAYRADLSVGLGDIFDDRDGRVTFYVQNLAAGYSAPGQTTIKDTNHYGGTFRMPVTSRLSLKAKGDQRVEDHGLKTRAIEMDIAFKLTDKWSLSTGVRNDLREDNSPVVPLTQQQGERTDAVAQVMFNPGDSWRVHGFIQDTVASSGGRKDNGRIGVGGSYRPAERFRIDAEVSDGDLGFGGRIGTNYLYSERTSLYLNYALENERTDNGLRARRGNLVSGAKTRLSDSSSVFFEERYQDHGSMTGLTHATGMNLVARERWNLGASGEFGTLRDSLSGAQTKRKATGISVGYGVDAMQLSSAIEYRRDDAVQLDTTQTERTAWLFRNSLKVSLTPDWRVIGKLNYSVSDSSLGDFYDGGFTEAVVGYAYRPVRHDRLSALVKYTYFYNVPTTDQITLQNTAAEFIQKSHIAALDLTFDVTAGWSIGGKYAYRLGQVSLNRELQTFFDNAAQLAVLRADWRFRKDWEGLVEARTLGLRDIGQWRRGALLAIYRYIGKNLKAGVGYNFTDFSDDLTDLGYDHKGLFVNIVGTK